MRQKLRAEELDFLHNAPRILTFAAEVEASPAEVFAAISADPATWTAWFPGLRGGRYAGPPPYGVGTPREVEVRGIGDIRETVLAWTEPSQFAYRINEMSRPIARALVEDWTLEPRGSATTVRWTFAIDPTPLFRLVLMTGEGRIGRPFHQAMRNLNQHLQR